VHAQAADRPTVLFAHPSPDLYGSDRMLLESVTAVVERGWEAVVALPADGPLAGLLRDRGARVVRCCHRAGCRASWAGRSGACVPGLPCCVPSSRAWSTSTR